MAMASPATAERGPQGPTLFVVTAGTLLGWAALVPIMSDATVQLCGAEPGPLGLVGLWTLMGATMMLPVATVLVARRPAKEAMVFLAGYLAITTVPSLGAGGLEILLRANGAMAGGVPAVDVRVVLAIVAGAALLFARGPRPEAGCSGVEAGRSHLGIRTAAAALQLAFGGMRPDLTLVLTLWMLAMTTSPFGGHASLVALRGRVRSLRAR
jgi:hypothetical protein